MSLNATRLRPSAEEPEPHRSVKSLGRGYVALAQVSLADPPDGHDIRFDLVGDLGEGHRDVRSTAIVTPGTLL